MSTAIAFPSNTATTFLTHIFGTGLTDERYVVERFKAHADGDILPWSGEATAAGKGRSRAKRVTATLKAVKELRPAPRIRHRKGRDPGQELLFVHGVKTTMRSTRLPGHGSHRPVASSSRHCVTERQPNSWGILRPGRMRVFRGARFRIRIALWMLTGLELVQRGTGKTYIY